MFRLIIPVCRTHEGKRCKGGVGGFRTSGSSRSSSSASPTKETPSRDGSSDPDPSTTPSMLSGSPSSMSVSSTTCEKGKVAVPVLLRVEEVEDGVMMSMLTLRWWSLSRLGCGWL